MPGPTIPRIAENEVITAKFLNTLAERIEKLYNLRAEPPLSFSTTGGVPMLRMGSSINSANIESAIATTTITAASSKSTYPITYGTGSVKLDIDGSTATQSATAISVRNRAPVSFASGDLLWVYFSGGNWYVIQRYCP